MRKMHGLARHRTIRRAQHILLLSCDCCSIHQPSVLVMEDQVPKVIVVSIRGRKEPEGKNAKGKNFCKLRGRKMFE